MSSRTVLDLVIGALRACTVRIWMQGGQPRARGNVLTAVLWLLALAAHLGYDYLVGKDKSMAQLGTASLLVYLVASLAVQRLVVGFRAQRLDPSGLGAQIAGQTLW